LKLTTNLGDGETNVSHNTKESRNALKKERNEKQRPEIDIPAEFMKEADQDKATPFNVDKDLCDGKREDYISDKYKELLKRDVVDIRVTATRYKYCKREVQRWLDKGYEEISRTPLGDGYEVRLKKKKKWIS